MCGRLDSYLETFANIRTDKNRTRWDETTRYRAPHKPFLLLSILDLIASGSLVRNFISPSFELAATFSGYWQKIMPPGTSGSMSYPFYHLSSSGFWTLVEQPGHRHRRGLTVSSVKRLRELYLGAKLEEDLFALLLMEHSREKIRNVLLENFFSNPSQKTVAEQAIINQESDKYSFALLDLNEQAATYTSLVNRQEERKRVIRDQGFRKAIVTLYEHRCALCGIRMLTPEGHTIVEAAHIVPWSQSQNDKPQNGLALCRLCHWSFDEGLMSVGHDYEVLVSPAVRQDDNYPGHMETLQDRGIFKPRKSNYWPDQTNLDIHRENIFRSS